MNRTQLQKLAEDRVVESLALLDSGHWSGAYYLVGYAVECGLKACILAFIDRTGVIFRDKDFAKKCWTHDIEELVKLAGLERDRGFDISANLELGVSWAIVKDWNEVARYQQWTELQARRLSEAVTDSSNGVLPWIKGHW